MINFNSPKGNEYVRDLSKCKAAQVVNNRNKLGITNMMTTV